MGNAPRSTEFGRLLQEYRLRAGLTQEALAERAGLGRRSIQGLERGENQPRRETIERLVPALALSPPEQASFAAMARPSPRARAPAVGSARPIAAATTRRSARSPSQSLPVSLTSFVGRDWEMAELSRLLASSRLLTLTGPPGTGKTRLAVEVARKAGPDFADGVFFVPLAPLADPDLVLSAVRQRLGLSEIRGRPLPEVLAAYLRNKSVLLALDNFEQVMTAATHVSDLLGACPGLRALVTSRSALRVRGEQVFLVPPLAVPDAANVAFDADADRYPAVRLFVERARAVKPDVATAVPDLRVVGEICRRLDGLPLAIELAAARSTILSPPAILARLEHRLPLLTGGARDLPARQQTLRAAIAWSDNLLVEAERVVFRRLAVFAGGWGVAAAAAVCRDEAPSLADSPSFALPVGSEPPEILDLLESLVTKSLIRLEGPNGPGGDREPRFGMFETLREYAGERLAESGESQAIRRRHTAYFLALAEEAGPKVYGADSRIWLDRLERDHDNFRAALRWAEEQGEAETSLRLSAALYRFWWLRDHAREGWGWLQRALAHETGRRPEDARNLKVARAQALQAAAGIAQSGFLDYAAAQPFREESLAMFRELGDRRSVANSLHNLAIIVLELGDLPGARSLFDESLELWRAVGEPWGINAALRGMAYLAMEQGDYLQARRFAEECLSLARLDGFPWHFADALHQLGRLAHLEGDGAAARARLEESLAVFRALGAGQFVARELCSLAEVVRQSGDGARARSLLVESLATFRDIGEHGPGVVTALEAFASFAMAQGEAVRALRLASAAASLRQAVARPVYYSEQAELDRVRTVARQTLGKLDAAAAWAEGQVMTREQAVAYALEEDADEALESSDRAVPPS